MLITRGIIIIKIIIIIIIICNSFVNVLQLEAGLGESETFYSWVIATFFIGSVIGSLSNGALLKYVPYWHLILISLLLHTVGYVLHATAGTGWVLVLSKLLSGWFIGADTTLSLAYISESISNYHEALKKLGKDDGKVSLIRNRLFALYILGYNIGTVIGTGT